MNFIQNVFIFVPIFLTVYLHAPIAHSKGAIGGIVCIGGKNANYDIPFDYRWGNGPWKESFISPNSVKRFVYYFKYEDEDLTPIFQIKYDSDDGLPTRITINDLKVYSARNIDACGFEAPIHELTEHGQTNFFQPTWTVPQSSPIYVSPDSWRTPSLPSSAPWPGERPLCAFCAQP